MTVCNDLHELNGVTVTCDLKKGHAGQHSEAFPVAGGKTQRVRWDAYPVCPWCKHYIPNDATPGAYPGAISRLDNATEICSDCGTAEAIAQFAMDHPEAR